jgi:hypothetical protein
VRSSQKASRCSPWLSFDQGLACGEALLASCAATAPPISGASMLERPQNSTKLTAVMTSYLFFLMKL